MLAMARISPVAGLVTTAIPPFDVRRQHLIGQDALGLVLQATDRW